MGEVLIDQAAGLRSLMARQSGRLVAVVEPDAPDVGTTLALSQALAGLGRKVLMIDEVGRETSTVSEPPSGLSVLQGHAVTGRSLGDVVAAHGEAVDFVLVDAAFAENGTLSPLAASARDVMVVMRGDDPSGAALTAAYGCIKRLHGGHALMHFRVLLQGCVSESQAYSVFCRLATVASRYLTVSLSFAGYLPQRPVGLAPSLGAVGGVARSMLLWLR